SGEVTTPQSPGAGSAWPASSTGDGIEVWTDPGIASADMGVNAAVRGCPKVSLAEASSGNADPEPSPGTDGIVDERTVGMGPAVVGWNSAAAGAKTSRAATCGVAGIAVPRAAETVCAAGNSTGRAAGGTEPPSVARIGRSGSAGRKAFAIACDGAGT